MKTNYSNHLIFPSGFVLFAALFFTSCTKEEVFPPKENKTYIDTQDQKVAFNAAPVTATENNATKSLPTLPFSTSPTNVTPFTVSQGQVLMVNVEGKQIHLELRQRPAGSTGFPYLIASTVGDSYRASITFFAQPGVEYFVLMSKPSTYFLCPSMESLTLSTRYGFILQGVKGSGILYAVVFSINRP